MIITLCLAGNYSNNNYDCEEDLHIELQKRKGYIALLLAVRAAEVYTGRNNIYTKRRKYWKGLGRKQRHATRPTRKKS